MSRNGTSRINLVTCKFDCEVDFTRTVENAAMTPRDIAELTAKGIPITPQAVEREIQGNNSWQVEPIFRRNMDMATAWELEKTSQAKAKFALMRQKNDDFMNKIKNSAQ